MARMANAIVLIGATVAISACANPKPLPMPPDLADVWQAGDSEAVVQYIENKLQANFGKPFPVLTLEQKVGPVHVLSDFFGQPLAILQAGGPCPYTWAWSTTLSEDGWQVAGYKLIVTVKVFGSPELETALDGHPEVYRVAWPQPGFLDYVRFYPAMFFVSEDGTFIGYQRAQEQPPVMWDSQADQAGGAPNAS